VLAIAVDALGADKVRAVMMPSPYTADISSIDAREMAQRLGARYDEISITPMFESFRQALAGEFAGLPEDATEENIQAHPRGAADGAVQQVRQHRADHGNKSEMATATDAVRRHGRRLRRHQGPAENHRVPAGRWRNANDPYRTGASPIPERIITRPPSAELRPDQLDQDSLPPYEILDGILARYMENDQGIEDIVAAGFDRAIVERVAHLIRINEYKRRQAPVGIRVTHRGFGKDWRYPITGRFTEKSR